MTTVFIGGSRAISRLNEAIREQLDNLIAKRCEILIGDANGADKAVQAYFVQRQYSNVTVFCMSGHCRNNLGGWPTKPIAAPKGVKGFAYYALKDKAMAHEAKCGLMLWDGESRGTLSNVLNLLAGGKKVMFYLAPEKSFHKLSNQDELDSLLARCDPSKLRDLKDLVSQQLRLQRV